MANAVQIKFSLVAESAQLNIEAAKARSALAGLGKTHEENAKKMISATDKTARKNAELVSTIGGIGSALTGIDPAISRVVSGTLRLSSGFTAIGGAVGAATISIGLAVEAYQQMADSMKAINIQRDAIIASSAKFADSFGFKGSWSSGTAAQMTKMLRDELADLKTQQADIIDGIARYVDFFWSPLPGVDMSAADKVSVLRQTGIIRNPELDIIEGRIRGIESNLGSTTAQLARDVENARQNVTVEPMTDTLGYALERMADARLSEEREALKNLVGIAAGWGAEYDSRQWWEMEGQYKKTMDRPGQPQSGFFQKTKWDTGMMSTRDNVPQTLLNSLEEQKRATAVLNRIENKLGLAS